MINLIPVVAPFALTGVAYIVAGVTGFFNAAWTSKLDNDGQLTGTYEDEYATIDLNSSEFNQALQNYETEQKQNHDQQLKEYVAGQVPSAQIVTDSNLSQDLSTKDTLFGVLKSSSIESIEQQKILNNNLSALNITLASIFSAKNSELVNQNQANAILSENLLALNKSMATLSTLPKITAEVNTSPKIANTVKMTPNFHVSMTPNIDISALTTANKTIAEGVQNQIQTNAKIVENLDKKNEHYDFQKEGTPELKDSGGNQISPREVEAKKNAEQLIEQEDTNKTTFDEISDFVEDALGIVEDGLETIVGSTDGFDLNFNPLGYLDKILVQDYIDHKDDYPKNPKSSPLPKP